MVALQGDGCERADAEDTLYTHPIVRHAESGRLPGRRVDLVKTQSGASRCPGSDRRGLSITLKIDWKIEFHVDPIQSRNLHK